MSSKVMMKVKRRKSDTQDQDVYKARALMTPNEIEFFERLVKAFPNYYIFSQVAMSVCWMQRPMMGRKFKGLEIASTDTVLTSLFTRTVKY